MRLRALRVTGLLVSILALGFLPISVEARQDSPPTSDQPPVTPVLSPPLKDVPPITEGAYDQSRRVIINLELPHPTPTGARPALPDGALQTKFGLTQPSPAGINIDGVPFNSGAPPDNDGRVGPNHYVQWVNTRFAIYDKAGTLLYGPALGNTLFTALGPSSACVTHNDGDPIVVYDILADRWVLTQFVVGASPTFSHQCVAVSATGDPLGAYYLYDFPTGATMFVDYPHWGVWPDSYYMTAHLFPTAGPGYLGQGVFAFDRLKMIAGLPAGFQFVNLGPAFGGALPSDLDSLTPPPPGSSNYVIAPGSPEWDGSAGDVLHIFKASATWGGSPSFTVTGPTDVSTAAFNSDLCAFVRACIPEPAPAVSTDYVDAISGQFMYRIAYRNFGSSESLVLNHTVNVAAASGHASNQAGVRWYEVRSPGSSPTIFQQGTYAPDASNRWMGSIAMDNSGNMALGYSKSDTGIFPEIDITGRLSGDPAGTMGSEVLMKAGLGSQTDTGNRWGDYTYMSVDPRDGCTFWYTNQYEPASGTFNWHTRVASFRFPSCVSPARGTITGLVTDAVTGAPIPGALVQTDNGFSGGTDSLGRYVIVLPPGAVNVTATDAQRNCTPSVSQPATVVNGGSTTLNFTLTGGAVLALGIVGIDDSSGNNNGVVNRGECVRLNLPLKNTGCATATSVSATLTTSTPGVTVTQATSTYPNMVAGGTAANNTAFQFTTSSSFVCGTPIAFTLTVVSSAGTTPLNFSVPTCQGTVSFSSSLVVGDPTQTGRLNRFAPAASCPSKACPSLASATDARHYKIHSVTNTFPSTVCATITTTTACSGTNFIFPVAYLGAFDPNNLCTNYVGDPGASPSPSNSFSVDIPAGQTLNIVVHEVTPGALCSGYSVQVTGLIDDTVAVNSSCGNFFTLTPCRLIDTRAGDPPSLVAGGQRTFIVTGVCGVSSTAQAISVNIAVADESAGGNLQIYPGGSPTPPTAVINYNSGQIRSSNAIITLGPGGTITVKCNQGAGTTDLVLDVNGYFK